MNKTFIKATFTFYATAQKRLVFLFDSVILGIGRRRIVISKYFPIPVDLD